MYFLRLLTILALIPLSSTYAVAEVNPFNPSAPPVDSSVTNANNPVNGNQGFSVRKPGASQDSNNPSFNLPAPLSESTVKEGFEPITESLDVVRIGEVNGMHIFRGTTASTYLFESSKKHKLKRIPQNAFNGGASAIPGVPSSYSPNMGSNPGYRGQSIKQMATGGMSLPPSPPSPNTPSSSAKR